MDSVRILWADDEIDLLKPHIILLEQKGYSVLPVRSGAEALEEVSSQDFDVVFLDENMPGMTGLEALAEIKQIKAHVPVVMITKSEEEYVMDDAIGSQIADYLIKPVNPKQLWMAVKKIVDKKRLVSEKVTTTYQQDFRQLSLQVNDPLEADEWIDVYKKIIFWELELEKSEDSSMMEILATQKRDANQNFSDLISREYEYWLQHEDESPLLSHRFFVKKVAPLLKKGDKPVVMLVVDNLRLDQWKVLEQKIGNLFKIVEDGAYFSILPTATNYARNALFAGLMPAEIQKRMGRLWVSDEDEGGKNKHEEEFLNDLLRRLHLDKKVSYNKIIKLEAGRQLADNISTLVRNFDLNAIVYNFVDMLSHARTDMEVIKELADDEAAYRSLTLTWFDHSPLHDILKRLSELDVHVVLTSDHGSIRVKHPVKIVGDRNTTTNLRYKQGKNLSYNRKEVIEFKDPSKIFLPKANISSSYVFSRGDDYFVYPNNYNHYVNFYRDTFQHGGVSLEEVIVPSIIMKSK